MPGIVHSFKDLLQQRLLISPLGVTQGALDKWFDSACGNYLLAQERRCLATMPKIPGYHLMQLGISPRPLLLQGFSNLHRFSIAASLTESSASSHAVASFDDLPLPNDVLDGALLHHALEFSNNPHEVLCEVVRTMVPGGHLVLVVFNPYSLFGVIKGWARLTSRKPIWHHQGLRRGRILDWLKVLHCQTIWQGHGGYSLPLCHENWLRYWKVLEYSSFARQMSCGAFYVIVARKQVARPILRGRRIWRAKPAGLNLFSLKETGVEDR